MDPDVWTVDVSVLIPVLNEERYIQAALEAMRAQEFAGEVEFIFIDGRSKDSTVALLRTAAQSDQRIRLLDNPQRRTPQALNLGLAAARGEFVARMDAHTHYPPRYLAAGVERLRRGDIAWVAGPQLATGVDRGSRRVALAMGSSLGSGGAAFRREATQEIDADSGFTGLWQRSTLERFGGWDEEWTNDQDYELAARIRAAGGRIVCIPEMAASYIPRDSLKRLARQYWRYGQYRVKTSVRHPQSMRRSHVLPPGVAVTVVLAVCAPRPLRRFAQLGVAVYAAALALAGLKASDDAPASDAAAVPVVLATMHLAAGFGFIDGCRRFGLPIAALAKVAGLRAPG